MECFAPSQVLLSACMDHHPSSSTTAHWAQPPSLSQAGGSGGLPPLPPAFFSAAASNQGQPVDPNSAPAPSGSGRPPLSGAPPGGGAPPNLLAGGRPPLPLPGGLAQPSGGLSSSSEPGASSALNARSPPRTSSAGNLLDKHGKAKPPAPVFSHTLLYKHGKAKPPAPVFSHTQLDKHGKAKPPAPVFSHTLLDKHGKAKPPAPVSSHSLLDKHGKAKPPAPVSSHSLLDKHGKAKPPAPVFSHALLDKNGEAKPPANLIDIQEGGQANPSRLAQASVPEATPTGLDYGQSEKGQQEQLPHNFLQKLDTLSFKVPTPQPEEQQDTLQKSGLAWISNWRLRLALSSPPPHPQVPILQPKEQQDTLQKSWTQRNWRHFIARNTCQAGRHRNATLLYADMALMLLQAGRTAPAHQLLEYLAQSSKRLEVFHVLLSISSPTRPPNVGPGGAGGGAEEDEGAGGRVGISEGGASPNGQGRAGTQLLAMQTILVDVYSNLPEPISLESVMLLLGVMQPPPHPLTPFTQVDVYSNLPEPISLESVMLLLGVMQPQTTPYPTSVTPETVSPTSKAIPPSKPFGSIEQGPPTKQAIGSIEVRFAISPTPGGSWRERSADLEISRLDFSLNPGEADGRGARERKRQGRATTAHTHQPPPHSTAPHAPTEHQEGSGWTGAGRERQGPVQGNPGPAQLNGSRSAPSAG
eukprot:gene14064-20007_t